LAFIQTFIAKNMESIQRWRCTIRASLKYSRKVTIKTWTLQPHIES